MMKMFEIRRSSSQLLRKANESAKHLALLTPFVFAAPFAKDIFENIALSWLQATLR